MQLVLWNNRQGYNGFLQINTILFNFFRVSHRPLVIMNVCNKCCKINTVSSTFELLQVLPWNNEIFIEKNGCLEMMSSCDNKLLFLYACLKPRRYHNWYLWYLLATILALQKRSKSERMSGCSYSFTIEKRQFIERMAATGLPY